jgi:tRNA (guanine37-N1)-methyltransferase
VVTKRDFQLQGAFRIFEPELLAGEPNYITQHMEHGIRYQIDFSRVFWNSRLNEVHKQMVAKLDGKSVVFDAFCGVGPFLMPAVKFKRVVGAYGNDLNPVSIHYLRETAKLNKVSGVMWALRPSRGPNTSRAKCPSWQC